MQPTSEQLLAVLAAARRLLEAREDQMLTREEWDALASAVAACEPPAHAGEADLVEPEDACPVCSERNADRLAWLDAEKVECQMCGTVYKPGQRG